MHGVSPADLIASHLWIVDHFCARYRRLARDADLHAAGSLGLCIAAERFEPDKGRAFSTYAWNWVKGYVLSEMRKSHVVAVPEHTARHANAVGEPIRGVVVFGVPDLPQEDEQERATDRQMRLRALRAAVRGLTNPLQRRAIWLLLEGESIERIAKALDLTQTRVSELLESAEPLLARLVA